MKNHTATILHQNATPEALDLVRKWIFGIWFIIIIGDPLETLSYMPGLTFEPVGLILKLIPKTMVPWLLNSSTLLGIKALTIAAIVCVILKRWLIPASVLASILLTFHQSFVRSFGLSDHAQIVTLFSVYLLTLFSIADHWATRNPKSIKTNLNGIPLICILGTLCVTYSFIGIYRVVFGKISVFTSDSLIYWIVQGSNRSHSYPWHFDQFVLANAWLQGLLKFGFVIGTFFEVFAPLCLISQRFRYAFLAVMLPFHFVIWFFMDILFWEQLLLFVIFFDVTNWIEKFRKRK